MGHPPESLMFLMKAKSLYLPMERKGAPWKIHIATMFGFGPKAVSAFLPELCGRRRTNKLLCGLFIIIAVLLVLFYPFFGK